MASGKRRAPFECHSEAALAAEESHAIIKGRQASEGAMASPRNGRGGLRLRLGQHFVEERLGNIPFQQAL